MGQYLSKIILIFFNQSQSVFIKVVIIGGILVIVGIILKIFHIGFAISNFFSRFQKKDVKKTVQKEISKGRNKTKKEVLKKKNKKSK